MKPFNGFPEKFEFSAIPKPFLAQVLPVIDDLDELKATLGFFRILYQKKGFPVYVTAAEISGPGTGFKTQAAEQALDKAANRGTIIKLAVVNEGKAAALYFLNDEKNREAARRIAAGELKIDKLSPTMATAPPPPPPELPDIFSLYEQNVGLLTPIIAEELKEALKLYPEAWIKDAIKEAVEHNKRNWRYISKILDNWNAGGRDDGTYLRSAQKNPDKYTGGKYGKFVQR
jgi:DnaD/phage-associated family protein